MLKLVSLSKRFPKGYKFYQTYIVRGSYGKRGLGVYNLPIQWVKMLAGHWLKGIFVGIISPVLLPCTAHAPSMLWWPGPLDYSCSNYPWSMAGVLRRYGQGSASWLQLGFPFPSLFVCKFLFSLILEHCRLNDIDGFNQEVKYFKI